MVGVRFELTTNDPWSVDDAICEGISPLGYLQKVNQSPTQTKPYNTMFTADVAVDNHNALPQDASTMLAHSQGTFFRVVQIGINTTAPAVGLSRAPQKTTKTTLRIMWYHMLVSWLHEPEKTKQKSHDSYSYVLIQQ